MTTVRTANGKSQTLPPGMELHYQILNLSRNEQDLLAQLEQVQRERREIEARFRALLEGRTNGKARKGTTRATTAPGEKDGRDGKRERVRAFLAQHNGTPVPLATIKADAGVPSKAVSRYLYELKKRGEAKRSGPRAWASV